MKENAPGGIGMEEKKKRRPLAVIAWVLLGLVLALACAAAAGWQDLSFGLGPWGAYTTDTDSLYLAEAYQQVTTRDLLITDRRSPLQDGGLVVYQLDGQRTVDLYDDLLQAPRLYAQAKVRATVPERVILVLRGWGTAVRLLHDYRYAIWGVSAALALFGAVMGLTARTRWKKRQQKLMRRNFAAFGEKYRQEDEEIRY